MPVLICGTTESGKTTLARMIARDADKRGAIVIVRDPVGTETAGGDWGKNAEIYDDDKEFFARIRELMDGGTPAHIFVDEAADLYGHQNPENWWIARKGRHYGLQVTFIAQRPKLLHPNVRSQCSRIYMFRLASVDRREVLADAGHESNLLQTPLDTGDFLVLNTGSAAYTRGNIFTILKGKAK